MKKLGLIFVLIFAYFVCVVDVYALDPITREKVFFDGYITTHFVTTGLVNNQSEIQDGYSKTYNYGDSEWYSWVSNYNLFGYYSNGSNNGQLIPYTRPREEISTLGAYFPYFFHYVRRYWNVTDPDGNVYINYQYVATDYVDITFKGDPLVTDDMFNTWRIDFAIHINMNTIPTESRRAIFNNYVVLPTVNNQGGYCTGSYDFDNERINVSCVANHPSRDFIVRIKNNISLKHNIGNLNSNYNYYGYADISAVTYRWAKTSDVGDLNMEGSPNGTLFTDYYTEIKGQSDDYFSEGFDYSNLNSLTSLLLKPLELLEIDPTPPVNYQLKFKVFKKTISIDNGYTLFWGKCNPSLSCTNSKYFLHDFYIGNTLYTASQSSSALNNFKIFWNFLFGGFAIYILIKKAINVTMQVFDPNIMKVGDL